MITKIDQKSELAAKLLKTLAHPLRMQIVLLLAQRGFINVSTLQGLLMANQSLLSHHLIKMKNRGIVKSVQKGQEIYYSLTDSTFNEVVRLLLKMPETESRPT